MDDDFGLADLIAADARHLAGLSDEDLRTEHERRVDRFAEATPLQLLLTSAAMDRSSAELTRRLRSR